MTELRMGQRKYRCQRCGTPMGDHGEKCYDPRRTSFDVSHNNLMEQDVMAGELLAAILEFKSIESIQNSSFANEFFTLLDARRRG